MYSRSNIIAVTGDLKLEASTHKILRLYKELAQHYKEKLLEKVHELKDGVLSLHKMAIEHQLTH